VSIPLAKHRIEALADGIFAIVATLIVLELHIPDLPRNASTGAIVEGLRHIAPPMFSFVATFVLAASFWILHQLLMHFIKHLDGVLLWLNVFFLMFVSLLPFSTGFLGRFKLSSTLPLAMYFGNQFLIGLLLCLQWLRARRKDHLTAEYETDTKGRDVPMRVAALTLGAGIAVFVAFLRPQLAFYAFVVPVLILRLVTRRRSLSASA
jgi:uncharacterized membrane protein